MPRTAILELVDTVFTYLNAIDDPVLMPFIDDWPPEPFRFRRVGNCALPVLACLSVVAPQADPECEKLVRALEHKATHLHWGQTYSTDDFGAAFLEKYGWTELIGIRGPIASEKIACGFLLLGPGIEYPPHSHAAEEVYVPLVSTAEWMCGSEPWVLKPGGVPIHQRSWMPHAIRTGSSPLLALYLWRGGDLAQKSRIEKSGYEPGNPNLHLRRPFALDER